MEWKEVRLGDIATMQYGKLAPKKKDEGKVPIFTGYKNVGYTDKINCYKNTIVVVARGVGGCGDVKITNEDCYLTNLAISVSLNEQICLPVFFYYLHQLENLSILNSGSAQPQITIESLTKYSFRIPYLEDQRRIASILSSLDRKIELNNKINADLEEMAQAIFKNWFVDFEPFKYGKFVDSELGMIPEGWKVGSYSEMIESLISGDWGKENPQGNYTHEVACVRGCDFQDINNGVRGKTPQRYILEKNYQAKHLKDKDILVEISGGTATVSTGRTSLVTEELLKKYKHDIVCTNFCKVLRPLSQFSSYVYYSWKYKYDNDIMFGYENGTSGIKNFAIKDFIEKEPVLIPREQDIVEFQKIIANLQKQKQIKGTENTTLSTLRDTLLPRLMSGELEVPE